MYMPASLCIEVFYWCKLTYILKTFSFAYISGYGSQNVFDEQLLEMQIYAKTYKILTHLFNPYFVHAGNR